MRDRTIREARNSLTTLIRDAEKGNPVRLTRHGKAVAVLMSEQEYRRLTALSTHKDPWQFLERWRAQRPAGLPGISDAEVDSWRDKSVDDGHSVSWET
jgi:prevent-host-death family protein